MLHPMREIRRLSAYCDPYELNLTGDRLNGIGKTKAGIWRPSRSIAPKAASPLGPHFQPFRRQANSKQKMAAFGRAETGREWGV
jgi:hypothetical protein